MKSHCKYAFLLAAGTALSLASALAAPLSVDQYLSQVQQQSPAVRGSEASAKGYELLRDSGDIVTTPTLTANWRNLEDKQEYPNPAFQGSLTKGNQYSVGVAMNTPVGLAGAYTWNVAHTNIRGASPAFLPLPNYFTSYNKLELSQSLLKNGFGAGTRAQRDALNAANRAQAYQARFQNLTYLVQAEGAYWRLAFARRAVEIQKESLTRAGRVLDWAKRRVGLQLGDKSDFLQAQASYDLRRLELSTAEEEERNAARAFNLLRNADTETVAETLTLPSQGETINAQAAEREGARLDLRAAEEQARLSAAQARLEKDKVMPTLDLVASLTWNGRDAARGQAMSEALQSDHATRALGINLVVPLNPVLLARSLRGNALTEEAASYVVEQRRLEADQSWQELSSRLREARSRLNLMRTLESVQKEKYENERQRLMRGRTTTYQATIFEQDYAQTQLASLRAHADVLQLLAQTKLFRGEK